MIWVPEIWTTPAALSENLRRPTLDRDARSSLDHERRPRLDGRLGRALDRDLSVRLRLHVTVRLERELLVASQDDVVLGPDGDLLVAARGRTSRPSARDRLACPPRSRASRARTAVWTSPCSNATSTSSPTTGIISSPRSLPADGSGDPCPPAFGRRHRAPGTTPARGRRPPGRRSASRFRSRRVAPQLSASSRCHQVDEAPRRRGRRRRSGSCSPSRRGRRDVVDESV